MASESAATTSNIQDARGLLIEAKINLRHAQNDYKEAETAFIASQDYKSLGSNNNERDQALAYLIQSDKRLSELRKAMRDAEGDYDRAELRLEQWLDERRHEEAVTWAKLADYLAGKADHIGHAPTQAARTALVDEATGEIVDELDEEGIPF